MVRSFFRERARSRAIVSLDALHAPAEPRLTRIVEQAAQAFAAPVSVLTLLHDGHLWVRASTGIGLDCVPRKDSFCTHVIDRNGLFEVCDAEADPVFATLPGVIGEPYARYYIGAPLSLDRGVDIGVLCVLDIRPRSPASRDQRAYLAGLARQTTSAIERRAHLKSGIAA